MGKFISAIFIFIISFTPLFAQPKKPKSSEIFHSLEKLNFLGSTLYIAAHPDDENTRLISYLANDVKARTAYLSITRGDGGQNLVGPELGPLLGVIRTQELLEARKIDGGEQMFTRANDFGYSKHPDETFEMWNKENVLSDVVHAIRKFKPDVIINRFDHRSAGSTHGHHTASAMLGLEAFEMAGDASKFPVSANSFGVWQPERLFFNTSWWFYGSQEAFEKADKSKLMSVETGEYFPTLGLSNGEMAAYSRSMHKSQGFGSTGTRGGETEYLELLKGKLPQNNNVFEGINTNWTRLEGGKEIGEILNPLSGNFNFKNPSEMLPSLLKAYPLILNLKDSHWREIKLNQLKQLILDCGGIFLEAVAEKKSVSPNESFQIKVEAVNRGNTAIIFKNLKDSKGENLLVINENLPPNEKKEVAATLISKKQIPRYSSPYWLMEKGEIGMYSVPLQLIGVPETPALEEVVFELDFGGLVIPFSKAIIHKFNDDVAGEVYQPFEILPEVTVAFSEKVLIFASNEPKEIPVIIRAGRDKINGTVTLQHPGGWTVSPSQTYELSRKGETQTLIFTVSPPKNQSEGILKPMVQLGDAFFDKELLEIKYGHIPPQSVLMPAEANLVRIDIEKKGQNIGYINGAGDEVPESLRQIGYTVITIPPSKINLETLKNFDAIVVGIRAYNMVVELDFAQNALNNYVENGGTLIVQYNTSRELLTKNIAPYPLSLSRDRVTDEDSEVEFLDSKHPVLNFPNKITQVDFQGWVQERGLYFPDEWSNEFTPILGMKDKGDSQSKGSLLVAKHGKGHYIYTGLSFFRQLPAGVSGAYRLFANLLSIGNNG